MEMFPDILKNGIVIIFAGCLASFLIIEGLIISQMHVAGPDNLDYLIVLGAQVYKMVQAGSKISTGQGL